jgi:DNA-binding CsgD family transcriptional regulator
MSHSVLTPRGAPSGLSRREQEVAALVAEGLTNREIAAELILSRRTIDTHVEHIRDKLRVRSRSQIGLALWRGAVAV